MFKAKANLSLIIPIIIFFIISISTIYSAETLLPGNNYLFIKQGAIYLISFFIVFIICKLDINILIDKSFYIYLFCVLSLLLVLIFGVSINGSKCWFSIPMIGTIQPSEFMKISLILYLSKVSNNFTKIKNISIKHEIIYLLKVFIIVLIPSILTFLEPDTGAIFIYVVIAVFIVFTSGIRYQWFIAFGVIITMILSFILSTYLFNQSLFIDLFGTDLFYRLDRIINWTSGSGMQLENSLMAIGSAGIFGYGFNTNPIYFPEPQTDFIFSVFASNYGLIGSIILLLLFIYFDNYIINVGIKNKVIRYKFVIAGYLGMLIYSQIQNISMTIGLLPITGITLPYISYGGSSLLSYMILFGIVLNIAIYNLKYKN